MRELRYNAVNLTWRNLTFGLDFIARNNPGGTISFLSPVNGSVPPGKDFPLFRIFGKTAVLSTDAPKDYYLRKSQADIGGIVHSLNKAMALLPDSVQNIICISHMGLENTRNLARQMDGIDLYLAGLTDKPLQSAEKVGDAYVFAVGDEGKYIGHIIAETDKNTGKFISITAQPVLLDSTFTDHPVYTGIIKHYKDGQKNFWKTVMIEEVKKPHFVSAETCGKCHEKEYEIWQKTGHSFALDLLRKRNSLHDPECLTCHTTGFQQYDGFWSITRSKKMADVQCEACHGGGVLHVGKPDSLKSRNDFPPLELSVCTKCHTKRQSPDFNFDKAWGKIEH